MFEQHTFLNKHACISYHVLTFKKNIFLTISTNEKHVNLCAWACTQSDLWYNN